MKAIIIAAGPGSRLKEFTEQVPKCLVKVNGKTILGHQLEAIRRNGISDISLIKGYKKEQVQVPDIKYYINDNFMNNNILISLMHAEKEMDDDFLAIYSDITFDAQIVKKLIETEGDIVLVVDTSWKNHYEGRIEHPIEEAEKVIFDQYKHIVEIGKDLQNIDRVNGEFIGMMKCTRDGARVFTDYFLKAKEESGEGPFIRASNIRNAYITDFIQYLTDQKIKIPCCLIEGGWQEYDTTEDLQKSTI